MFFNENNDFIGEQYELVKLKYSSIIFGVEAQCVYEAFSYRVYALLSAVI